MEFFLNIRNYMSASIPLATYTLFSNSFPNYNLYEVFLPKKKLYLIFQKKKKKKKKTSELYKSAKQKQTKQKY